MFFCPKCNFSLDLSKNIPSEISGNLEIKMPKDFIDLMLEDEFDESIKLAFSKKELENLKEYKKLSPEEKVNIIKKFEEINNIGFNLAYFICKNCQFVTKLNGGTKLYEVSIKSEALENTNDSEKLNDLTLPRTKDYVCINKTCKSQKNTKDKEAIFFRPFRNSYELKYICTLCNESWLTGSVAKI